MKLLILPLLVTSIGIAEAGVYKCPSKINGRYTYQEKPCSKAIEAVEKNIVEIVPTNKKKVEAAVEKLENELKVHQVKKDKAAKTEDKTQTQIKVTLPPPVQERPEKEMNNKNEDEEPVANPNQKS